MTKIYREPQNDSVSHKFCTHTHTTVLHKFAHKIILLLAYCDNDDAHTSYGREPIRKKFIEKTFAFRKSDHCYLVFDIFKMQLTIKQLRSSL